MLFAAARDLVLVGNTCLRILRLANLTEATSSQNPDQLIAGPNLKKSKNFTRMMV